MIIELEENSIEGRLIKLERRLDELETSNNDIKLFAKEKSEELEFMFDRIRRLEDKKEGGALFYESKHAVPGLVLVKT